MIRLANLEDIDIISQYRVDLEIEDWKDNYSGNDNDLKEANKNYLKEHLNKDCIIYVYDDNINGVVAVCTMLYFYHLPDCDDLNSKRGFLCNIYTHKDFRKQGIQKKLIEKILKKSKKDGVKKFTLNANPNNENALSLYRKFGFEFDSDTGEFKMLN